MQPIHLAFLWHQHQPFYKDLVRGQYVLPWVRLHAIKDYVGMLLVLKEFPEFRCTINLVPSLIAQIREYANGQAEDTLLRVTRKPAADLNEADRRTLMEHGFRGNPDRLIRVFPRFRELFERRGEALAKGVPPAKAFSEQELRDAQVWATLAWFHPLVVESDEALRRLREKGKEFSEDDKAVMLERQDDVLGRVLPLHRELAEAGQIEISTTPFYHPILPLLCNMESAREALPDLPMPETRSDFAPDAEVHVARAIELHKEVFGCSPAGMWPSEGSVSMDILPLLRGRGIRWIATDEQILARSAEVDLSRDGAAVLHRPDGLYQPYALADGDDLPAVVFRDHALADAIGFEYHHGEPGPGAENFVWRIEESARRCAGRPRLISVILDGENPWDYYGEAGLTFLRELYGRILRSEAIATTRLGDYLDAHPPTERLGRLAAGSWIDANFAIWIGGDEDREAWGLLAEAREAVVRRARQSPPLDADAAAQAWEHIYIAEGSDWCWWFGSDHTSEQDYMFDRLFRSHLANAYRLIGEAPPAALSHAIGKPDEVFRPPTPAGALDVVIDGRVTDDSEWADAGHVAIGEVGSAMRRADSGPLKRFSYGFNRAAFLLRLDCAERFQDAMTPDTRIVIRFGKPHAALLNCERLTADRPAFHVLDENGKVVAEPDEIASGDILELACPIGLLAAGEGDRLEFHMEVLQGGTCVQRVPREGGIGAPVRLAPG